MDKEYLDRHARLLLEQLVREYGNKIPANVIRERAEEEGVSLRALGRAKRQLRVKSMRMGGAADRGRWYWVQETEPSCMVHA